MAPKVQIKRTPTTNKPPPDGSLSPGELAIEMATPTRLWVGVPTSIDVSGKKLLYDSTPAPDAGDFYSKAESESRYVNVTGDTMSGDLAITKASGASAYLTLSKAPGDFENVILGAVNGVQRWQLRLGNATTEGGANSGSDFSLARCNDAGTLIDSVMSVARASGVVGFSKSPTVPSPAAGEQSTSVPNTAWVLANCVTRINVIQVTTSQVYVPGSPGLKWVVVELVGGGAGGGGIGPTPGDYVAAGGGGAGAYAARILSAAQVGAGQAITIGAGGAGNVPGNVDGGTGGTTSFGALVSAVGGVGDSNNGAARGGGAGGEGIYCVGDVRISGGGAGGGFIAIDNVNVGARGGAGGNSFFGCGAASPTAGGLQSSGYGGGGSGGCGTSPVGGGQGAQGLCKITEIY